MPTTTLDAVNLDPVGFAIPQTEGALMPFSYGIYGTNTTNVNVGFDFTNYVGVATIRAKSTDSAPIYVWSTANGTMSYSTNTNANGVSTVTYNVANADLANVPTGRYIFTDRHTSDNGNGSSIVFVRGQLVLNPSSL